MLIYVKNIKKKQTFYGRTDGRTTQNYSSEPHKICLGKLVLRVWNLRLLNKCNFFSILEQNLILFIHFNLCLKTITLLRNR